MNYKKLVPPDSFIGQYLQWNSNIETAEAYDFWCAIWLMGAVCGRTVYVDRPHSPVHLNWYIIFAAESGTTRKTTAVKRAKDCLLGIDGTQCISGKTSPEGLELRLHHDAAETGESTGNIVISELVTILGREGYMTGMPGLLTDLYDYQEERVSPGTIKSGTIHMKHVYISLLSASTPTWLLTAINPSVIEGGFTSRVIFISGEVRKRAIAWPERREGKHQLQIRTLLGRQASRAREYGAIAISKGGLKRFKNWYNNRTTSNDSYLSSFEAREDDHVLRIAACLAINDETFEIQAGHISKGIRIISSIKSGGSELFGGNFSTSTRVGEAIGTVRRILVECAGDGIKHSMLFARLNKKLDTTEYKLLMSIMHEAGYIQIFNVQKGGKVYRATKKIEQHGIVTKLLDRLNVTE